MPYIIDGNNLIGSSTDISLDDPDARKKILFFIKKFQEYKKNNVIVVFDGEPADFPQHQGVPDKFSIQFPRYGSSADELIKKILGNYKHSRDVILVTSDRALKSYARNKGFRTINSIEFYFELKRIFRINGKKEASLQRINTELSDKEVDLWLKIFDKK